jgi:imidazolonepropionase-like amidohydrolase
VVLVGTEYLAIHDAEHGRWVNRLERAVRAGVTMAYGTDVIDDVPGQTRGTEAMRGIEIWIEAKVPARLLVQAMTTNAARLLGVSDQRGAIAKGLAADLIATPQNPLEHPETLKQVSFVMKDGTIVRQGTSGNVK